MKRNFKSIGSSQSSNLDTAEPPKKKQKLSNESQTKSKFSLFTQQTADVNVDRTIAELADIPAILCSDNHKKEQYILNKFFIAANVDKNAFEYQCFPFRYERMVSFIDNNDNICLITDNYRIEPINDLISEYFRECNAEIYHNPGRASMPVRHRLDMHREYVLILREPYCNFSEKYHNSFEEFLISSAKTFHTKTSQYIQETDDDIGILHVFHYFFEACVQFNPKSVLATQSYPDLFNAYNKMQDQFQFIFKYETNSEMGSIYPVFTILFEIFDKPWIEIEEIEQSVKLSWNMIQKSNYDYFEPDISMNIIQYLHDTTAKPYNFEHFIAKQMNVHSTVKKTQFIVSEFYGQYTRRYEQDYFESESMYLLNPLKWKYFDKHALEQIKSDLIQYKTKKFAVWCTLELISLSLKVHRYSDPILDFRDISDKFRKCDQLDEVTLDDESWKIFAKFDIYSHACIKVLHPWTNTFLFIRQTFPS